jgi:hypothetical protein
VIELPEIRMAVTHFEALVERWAGILVSDGYAVYR